MHPTTGGSHVHKGLSQQHRPWAGISPAGARRPRLPRGEQAHCPMHTGTAKQGHGDSHLKENNVLSGFLSPTKTKRLHP